MKKIALLFFAVVAVAELIAVSFNIALVQTFAKPLIMITLMIYYFYRTSERNNIFLAALVFCWMGDVLLMFQGDEMFFITDW